MFKRFLAVGSRGGTLRSPPYRLEHPQADVPIAMLVSPLRFDVLIRADFFTFCRQHQELYRRDPDSFVKEALGHFYYLWFCAVFCRRFRPELLKDDRRRREEFAIRVKRSIALSESFRRRGLDTHYPITLRAGETVEATSSGKLVVRPCYAGDGCHRLALLLASGQRYVPAAAYRVKIFPKYRPLDNTHELLDGLGLGRAQYYAFIAQGYDAPPAGDRITLLSWVQQHRPEALHEVEQVTAIDEARLRQDTPEG
jgi:hypothetical protein